MSDGNGAATRLLWLAIGAGFSVLGVAVLIIFNQISGDLEALDERLDVLRTRMFEHAADPSHSQDGTRIEAVKERLERLERRMDWQRTDDGWRDGGAGSHTAPRGTP